MAITVDASVALKWVLEEAQTVEARTLLERPDLIAPDLLILECASTLSRAVRRRMIDARRASVALEEIRRARVRLFPAITLLEQAQKLALELNAATYDCIYLALAIKEEATLLTADLRFFNAATSRPANQAHVRRL